MPSLYELEDNWEQVFNMLNDPDVDEEMILDTLEAIEGEIEIKAVGYAKVIKNLEADIPALKEEIDRLERKKKSKESKAKFLKLKLEETMKSMGRLEIKTDLFDFKIQKNPPGIDVLDIKQVPDIYKIPQEVKIDKRAILQDLKNGAEIKGVEIKQSEGLRIR